MVTVFMLNCMPFENFSFVSLYLAPAISSVKSENGVFLTGKKTRVPKCPKPKKNTAASSSLGSIMLTISIV